MACILDRCMAPITDENSAHLTNAIPRSITKGKECLGSSLQLVCAGLHSTVIRIGRAGPQEASSLIVPPVNNSK